MKKSQYIILIFIILGVVTVNSLQSQTVARIYTDFRKVEIYMVKVWELVQQFNDQRAVQYMILAKSELDRARELLYTATPNYFQAKIHVARAKYYTDLAARIVLAKPFLNLKSQLDDLINRAEKAVSNSNSDEAHYLLNQSKRFRRIAYDAFRKKMIGKGEEYYRISFFFAKKCIEYVRSSDVNLEERFKNLEVSVRQLLIQAEELLSAQNKMPLQNLVKEAEKHFEEAIALANEGKMGMAITRLRLIKRLIYRVFDQAERGVMTDQGRVENNLYSLRTLLESLDSEFNNSNDPNVKVLLNKAWDLYRKAELEYEDGNYAKCQGTISLCQRFANKLFRMTKRRNRLDANELAEQLKETQNMLELQRDRVYQSNNRTIIRLYEESGRMLDRAEKALDNNKEGVAFQLTQAATRMSARIQRELHTTASDKIEKLALERTYQQLMSSITGLESNEQIQNNHMPVLNQLKQFVLKGKQYYDEGKYILADEYFSTAWEQIKQYTDRWRK